MHDETMKLKSNEILMQRMKLKIENSIEYVFEGYEMMMIQCNSE